MRYFIPIFIIIVLSVISILGFRGSLTENTPIEVFPDMDRQAKFKSQTQNSLFYDKLSDRLPVEGTAIRGNLISQTNVFSEKPEFISNIVKSGKSKDGSWVNDIPSEIQVDMSLVRLGREKYDIHCAICHGKYGDGKGVISYFGLQPRNLSDPTQTNYYLESKTDGETFNTISNGYGTMLGLKDKLTPRERWAIVLYIRALKSYVSNATKALNIDND